MNSQQPNPSDPQMDPPMSQQEKMAMAQQEQERWASIAARPNLSPQAATVAMNAARSAAAEVRLRQKGLAWLGAQTDDQALAQVLGLNSSPQNQQNPSEDPIQNSSISPGTSGLKT